MMDLLTWGRGAGGRKQEEERFAALEKALEDLRRDSKVIRLEWEDVYDRITRTMGRLNARIRKAEATEEPEGADQEAARGPTSLPTGTGTHGLLEQARRGRR